MDIYRNQLKEDIKLLLDEIYNVRVLMIIRGMLEKIIEKSNHQNKNTIK